MSLTINIIGTGRLGTALGRAIATLKDYHLLGICNQHWDKSRHALDIIGEGKAYESISELPNADITFITCTDDNITSVATSLSHSTELKSGAVIAHCSGVLDSTQLAPLSKLGMRVASIHPMRSFADPLHADFQSANCAIEGETSACQMVSMLFSALGATVIPIQREQKPFYHTAGVFGSNFLISLASLATRVLRQSGFTDEQALNTTLNLMQGSLDNLKRTRCIEKSLTGPFIRGDKQTIQTHLKALTDESKTIYTEMGKLTLSLSSLDEATETCINDLLNQA